MKLYTPFFFSIVASAAIIKRNNHADGTPNFQYVAAFSVDGLHASDIDKWLAKGPSNISQMLQNGYLYTGSYTTFPSDSFPGTVAQYTGGFPRTTGVWYDDTWDRSYFPANSSCKLPPGSAPGAEGTINTNGYSKPRLNLLQLLMLSHLTTTKTCSSLAALTP